MFKKIIAFLVVFAMVISLTVIPAFAGFAASTVIYDGESADAMDSYLERQFVVNVGLINFKNAAWNAIDGCFSVSGLGAARSLDVLQSWCDSWNSRMRSANYWGMVMSYIVTSGFDEVPLARVVFDPDLGVYRFKEVYSGLWLTKSNGHFPYYRPESDSGEEDPDQEIYRTGQWVESSKLGSDTDLWHVASNYELNEYRDQWLDLYPNAKVTETTNYYWLTIQTATAVWVLCDKYGYPYYLPKDGKTAIGTENNYYQDTTNEYIDDDSVHVEVQDGGSALVGSPIDVNNGIVNVGGEVFYIDELIYDASTQTYYVDAHDQYVFNSTTNNYTTNNYSFTIQYHIDHTSITYIGQTEEYEKRYEMYFELPDGRSSADLTAEDLEQLSVVFSDVIPYNRTADNLTQRVLYHFDGNTEDSSYFSYCTNFSFWEGASITYMDEGVFGGSLYLDEKSHEFVIALPSNLDVFGDWTLQWRYYQSHTEAPAQDTCFSIGGQTILSSDGQSLYWGDFEYIAAEIPIGSWFEICLEHNANGYITLFLNGVWCDSYGPVSVFYNNWINFTFGSEQQTYKKLDELRYTSALVYDDCDYIPSSVPFDSNLTLILPDGDSAIADEVPVFSPADDRDNLLSYWRLDNWSNVSQVKNGISTDVSLSSDAQCFVYYSPDHPTLFGNGHQLSSVSEGAYLRFSGSYSVQENSHLRGHYDYAKNALFLPLAYQDQPAEWFGNQTQVTLTFVYTDGVYTTVTLSNSGSVQHIAGTDQRLNFQFARFTSYNSRTDTDYYTDGILITGSAFISYAELVFGNRPGFTYEYESAVYKSSDLKTPTLAVKTNREITGYQIGGVRPSYPTTGLVYAMVENSRIVSLQQYTGYAWEAVDGRIWTGERWIPYSSFDVFTLQDFYDIIGGSDEDYEYIYTESGFWHWLQGAWSKMLQKLDAIILALGGDPNALPGGSSGNGQNLTFWQRVKKIFEDSLAKILESLLELITNILDRVLGLVYDLLDFFFGLITDIVVEGIGGFFDALMDEALLHFFRSDEPVLDEDGNPVLDEDGNPVTVPVVALPAGVAGIFSFISAVIMVLPDELRYVLFFGIGALFLLGALKLVRS